MMTAHASRATWAALGLATLVHAAAGGVIDPQQTQVCNEPPPLAPDDGGRIGAAKVSGDPLEPGDEQDTLGTNTRLARELNGFFIYTQTRDFSFNTVNGVVAGKYTEGVMRGKDKKCKCHVQIAVQRGCIGALKIEQFAYRPKAALGADWRTDFPGNVPSETVERSDEVNGPWTITFRMKADRPVCAGQTSKWLLLNTNINQVAEGNHLKFVTPAGHESALFPLHVPSPP